MFKLLFSLMMALFLLSSCANKENTLPFSQNKTDPVISNMPSSNVDISPYKAKFIAMINAIRTKGTPCAPPTIPLMNNIFLEKAAMMHARDLAINNLLQHDGSGTASDYAKKAPGIGSNFVDRIIFFGYPVSPYHLVGESITKTNFKNKSDSNLISHFQRALKTYINDPIHCKILMNPRFQDVGIGVYKQNNAYYWVIVFGERDFKE